MTRTTSTARDHEWLAYYERFPYFTANAVRDGCQPRILEHAEPAPKAVVLVHGLTDSPHFMTAIAEFFYGELGYDVYLPLLQCHGLAEPRGMEDVKLEQWKANVSASIAIATARKERPVSIGGLSTGGTLSFYAAANDPRVTGALYLFSAALDLAGGPFGWAGEIKELLARHRLFVTLFDDRKSLIGRNPFRYEHMDLNGASELAQLMKETDALIAGFRAGPPFQKRVFAAHSEADATADIQGIRDLEAVSLAERFTFFRIPREAEVPHASLVLRDPVCALDTAPGEAPLEEANPHFAEMMAALKDFERRA